MVSRRIINYITDILEEHLNPQYAGGLIEEFEDATAPIDDLTSSEKEILERYLSDTLSRLRQKFMEMEY